MTYKKRLPVEKVISTIRHHMIGDAFEFVLDLDKSHGSYIFDAATNREILDFYSCFASNPLGFNHPGLLQDDVMEKLSITARNNVTNSDLFTDLKAEFVDTFYSKAAPATMPHMFLVAGGSLAVENALKAAFDWKARKNLMAGNTSHRDLKVMHLRQAFHGRSGYTLSLTNTEPAKTEHFPKFDWPRLENPKIVFPDEGANHDNLTRREMLSIVQAKHAVLSYGDSIAACIVEPIQGEGGDNHFRPEYLMTLQAVCQENDIMFIVDEIQTGVGITGKMWAYEHYGLKPDMLCFGKKTQVCGFLCSNRIDEVEDNVFAASGRINSTWGGTLVDMVRCLRYLEIIEEEHLIDNAARMGKLLLQGLHDLQTEFGDIMTNTRGKGLMCAFDLKTSDMRNALRNTLFDKGMLVLSCGEKSIRFRPALNVGASEIAQAMQILRENLPSAA